LGFEPLNTIGPTFGGFNLYTEARFHDASMNQISDPRRFPFPPAVPLVALLFSWGLGKIWSFRIQWPGWLQWAGWALFASALLLVGWAIATFRRYHTTPDPRGKVSTIVTTGPFRYSRNPMYVALMLIYIGVMLVSRMGWAVIFLFPVFLTLQYLIIVPEEQHLRAAFGDDYIAYNRRVRRWL
jgi:protein-S-isoprenylcysteine O-methyltransferase Ste14